MESLPYRAWPDAITPKEISTVSPAFAAPRYWGKAIGYLRATGNDGATQLWRLRKGEHVSLTSPRDRIGSRLYGYGATAWAPLTRELAVVLLTNRSVALVVDKRGNVAREIPLLGSAQGYVTGWSESEFAYVADWGEGMGRGVVVAHWASGLSRVVHRTEHFVGYLTADATVRDVAWLEWPVTAMPWEASRLYRAPRSYLTLTAREVFEGAHASFADPRMTAIGLIASEQGPDWFTPRLISPEAPPHSFSGDGDARADWSFGWRWSGVSEQDLLQLRVHESTTTLWRHRSVGNAEPVADTPSGLQEIDVRDGRVVACGSDGLLVSGLWEYDITAASWKLLASVKPPKSVRQRLVPTEMRRTTSGVPFVFSAARRFDVEPVQGDRPGLVVDIHGGPTAYAGRRVRLATTLWTSSGFAVASVDYRGSTSYGAAYRDALNGYYGIADVHDVLEVVTYLMDAGEVDAERVYVRGTSSGGMTALLAGASPLIAGVIAHYPVTDPLALARTTHEFELSYLETLIAPLDGGLDSYRRVSPIEAAVLPGRVLMSHGSADGVIPIDLTRRYVAALQEQQASVTYLEFEGEGHGYRNSSVVEQVLDAELRFLRTYISPAP